MDQRLNESVESPSNLAIQHFSWGRIGVSGREFKDVRLFPGGVEAWDWRKTGTRHDPGIQIEDARDLLATNPRTIILSRGVDLVLQVPSSTVEFFEAQGLTVLVLQSEEAVDEYNRRIAKERVVALIHSTC
jgi:hypothetical protein